MFKPTPMVRLRLLVLERDARSVLRALGKAGAVELTQTPTGPEGAPLPSRDHAEEVARCDRLLKGIEDLRRSWGTLPVKSEPAEPPQLTLDEVEERLQLLESKAQEALRRRQTLAQRLMELDESYDRVAGYRAMEIPLVRFERFSFLHAVTGTIPSGNYVELQCRLGRCGTVLPLKEAAGRQRVMVLGTRADGAHIEDALEDAGFRHEPLPVVEGQTTNTLIADTLKKRDAIKRELSVAEQGVITNARESEASLAAFEQLVSVERRLREAEKHFARTQATALLTGWIPSVEVPAMERRLEEITGARFVMQLSAPEAVPGEEVPVLLRHPQWLRPFGRLVTAYGLPQYRDLEPTLFLAISYLLMFGMMFGDVGHGALLALGGYLILRRGRGESARDVGRLLLYASVSSIGFGLVYGSCFGLAVFKRYALWRDPLEGNPVELMSLAIAGGVVMISLGLILNIINRLRRGDFWNGLLDKFGLAGLLFYWGALAIVIDFTAIQSRGMVSLMAVACLGVPMLGCVLKGPFTYFSCPVNSRDTGHREGLGATCLESWLGVFEGVLSFLANTISFVRLAAYAMSHAALLAAAFMLATALKQSPVAGGILSVLMIILGNLVAILLEGIIASVQALRLEYYEFFGKFFSGDGRAFKPFSLAAAGRAGAGMAE
jgi:V/A-type H+/Na+-transporting ATPase subunit I